MKRGTAQVVPKITAKTINWDGSGRPIGKAVPGLTCDGTAGTTGTATPRFGVINGGGGAA